MLETVRYWIGRALLRLAGFKVYGTRPALNKYVIIAGPHTSNWDFYYFVLAKWYLRIPSKYMVKDNLFFPPVGWILSALGGIPINRRERTSVVDQMVAQYKQRDKLVLLITPEGTRKYTPGWKTGFYHIAVGAGVPILIAAVNYRHKTIRLSSLIYPTGDIHADFDKFREFYTTYGEGAHPDKHSLIVPLQREEKKEAA